MDMSGSQRIEATPATVWAALNDVDVLKACIPGCESINKTSDTVKDGNFVFVHKELDARTGLRYDLVFTGNHLR